MSAALDQLAVVAPVRPEDVSALEAFLRQSEESTVFYSPAWQNVIRETYQHSCHYFIARAGGSIAGAFPVVLVHHPVLGTKLVAAPYQFHSGLPLAQEQEVRRQLVNQALEYARSAGARYFEVRHWAPAPFLEEMGFVSLHSQLVNTSVPLGTMDPKSLREGHGRYVHYAQQRGVEILEKDRLEDLLLFRRLYAKENKEKGSPVAGEGFFRAWFHHMSHHIHLLLAYHDGSLIGGLATVDDGRSVFARCGAYGSPRARELHLANALLWRAMTNAAQRGCRSFNLGISWVGDKGLIRYKEGWNGITTPVYLYVHSFGSRPPAPGAYFEGFQLAKAIWRRLPLPLVDWLGHQVTRWVC